MFIKKKKKKNRLQFLVTTQERLFAVLETGKLSSLTWSSVKRGMKPLMSVVQRGNL